MNDSKRDKIFHLIEKKEEAEGRGQKVRAFWYSELLHFATRREGLLQWRIRYAREVTYAKR